MTVSYDTIISNVEERIFHPMVKFKFQQTEPIQNKEVLDCLDDLYEKFVAIFFPINKASINIFNICKKLYVEKILLEVGKHMVITSANIFFKHANDVLMISGFLNVQDYYRLNVYEQSKHKSLLFIYWMPKLHYTLSQIRFIIESSQCSTKPISKVVSKLFKKIINQINSFDQRSTFHKN